MGPAVTFNPKLIVCGIHLFQDQQYKTERGRWENDVTKQLPRAVKFISMPISHTAAIYYGADQEKAYEEQLCSIKKRLKEPISGVKKMTNKVKETFGKSDTRSGNSTRYMFIADELAAWMVKDLMLCDSEIRESTVAIIFRGVEVPVNDATEVLPVNGRGIKYTESLISNYLINLRKVFGAAGDTNDRTEGGLLWKLVKDEYAFAKLESKIPSAVWQITTQCGYGVGDRKSARNDIKKLIVKALECVRHAKKSGVTQDPVMTGINQTGNSPVTLLSQAKHRYALPVGMKENDTLWLHPELSPRMLNLKNRAMTCFYANDLKNADRLFAACIECPDWETQQHEKGGLEIALLHGVTCLHIGRYHEAMKKLKEALDNVKVLRKYQLDTKDDPPTLYIEICLMFWYSTALMRVGDYKVAREKLKLLLEKVDARIETNDAHHTLFLEVQVTAHQTLSIIESCIRFLENPMGIDEGSGLNKSERLLASFETSLKKEHQPSQDVEQDTKHAVEKQKIEQSEQQSFISTSRAPEPAILRQQLELARSQIWIFQGNLRDATPHLQKVLEALGGWLGPNHILTLEATVLLAALLVNTSRVVEGEQLAADARSRISKHLNKSHPLAMEATHLLIIACISQGREEEALRVSQHLCKEAEAKNVFGFKDGDSVVHPKVSTYYTQLSDAHISVGNYMEAESCLEDMVFKRCDSKEGMWDLIRARNLSHLAWSLLHLGKYRRAEEKLGQALKILLDDGGHADRQSTSKVSFDVHAVRKNTLDDSKTLLERLAPRLGNPEKRDTEDDSIRIHPDILFTLRVCSELESRQSDADVKFVLDARETLCHSLRQLVGKDSAETLRAQLAWAHAMNNFGHSRNQPSWFADASKLFKEVFEYCRTGAHLYQDHPLGLESRRESWLSKIMSGPVSEENLKKSVEVLGIVMRRQQRSLGPYRTQTLQTCLSYLSARIAVLGDASEKEAYDLLERLRDPKVQEQRLVESLLMEERMTEIYTTALTEGTSTKNVYFQNIRSRILEDLLNPQEHKFSKEGNGEITFICHQIQERARAVK